MDPEHAELIKSRYRKIAASYDDTDRIPERLRPLAVARLALRPGETVLDFGCGTGLSFDFLERDVGPGGRIIGVELSPEMLALARKKIEAHRWTNITLIEGNAEEVEIPGPVDAVLTFFTPDIMSSRRALDRALEVLRPGGRLVAAGAKRAEGIRGIRFNLYFSLRYKTWRFMSLKDAFNRLWHAAPPYIILEELVGPLDRRDYIGGSTYIAYAVKETPTGSRPAA